MASRGLTVDNQISGISRRRRRILYLMHVNWRWIKQRPQFVAEGLSTDNDVRVLYPFAFKRRNRPSINKTSVTHSALPPIPWTWTNRWWVRSIHRQWISKVSRDFRPDTIWLTYPKLIDLLPTCLSTLPIIYDCMDDALGFSGDAEENKRLAASEKKLLEKSAKILCSSENLSKILVQRYGSAVREKLSVIRNAISPVILQAGVDAPQAASSRQHPGVTRIGYVGTVAEWFDFDLLLKCLWDNSGVEFHLLGPVLSRNAPTHDRLHYHGPVPHDALRERVREFDACMMPFRLSPLIEAVDPVKLYEYLAFGQEIFSIHYDEIERFGNFVHFYRTDSEFLQLVRDLETHKLPRKNYPETTRSFLEQNTWPKRIEQIDALMQFSS